MTLKHKVLGVSVLAGLLLWVADAGVHFFFFHDEPFLDVLILAIPPHEIYVRSLGFVIVLALGFVLAAQFAKRERIQQEVRKSRGFLQTVIDAIPAATMVIGRDYKVALANRAARDMAGGKDPAARRLTCHQVSHHRDSPCSGEEHPCPLKEVIATKAPVTVTHTHYDAEGNEVFVEITAAPIFDDRGEVSQIIESCRDITDRTKAQEELEKYKLIVESAHDAVFIKDRESRYVVANNKALEAFGLSREQVIGKSDREIMPNKEEADANIRDDRLLLETGKSTQIIKHMTAADGTERWYQATKVPQRDSQGNIIGIIGIAHDITERKQAEEALRESEQKYRQLVSSLHEGVWVIDADSRTTFVNERMADMLGYAVEEMMGRSLFSFMDQQGKQIAERNVQRRRDGIREQHEFEFLRKDGTRIHTLLATAPITDDAGRYAGAVAGVVDITDRKRAEEEIADLAKFPAENPDPVLRVAGDGTVTFANKAAESLLDSWSCQPGAVLPTKWAKLIREVLVSGRREDVEIDYDGRVFLVTFAPVVEAGYVNLYGRDITDRKETEEAVKRSRQELRALAARLQAAREEERIRLARRIHDDVGHNLAALKRDLALLGGEFPKAADAPRTPKLRQRLESMSKLLAETIQTARETASELRPGLLDDVGLAAAIEWQAKQFQRRTGVKCRFADTAEQTQLDHEQSTALFRICQELLTNIANHAGATAVTIALKRQRDELILEVSDNGKGIKKKQVSSARSLGILGMRERALVLGGTFSISGIPGKGTTATVQIPLGAAQAKGR